MTSVLDGVGGQRHAPADFTPGKYTVPIVQEGGWASGPVWTGAENLAPTRIRSPDRPARSDYAIRPLSIRKTYVKINFKSLLSFLNFRYTTLTEVFSTLNEGFPCFFLSCKANARV